MLGVGFRLFVSSGQLLAGFVEAGVIPSSVWVLAVDCRQRPPAIVLIWAALSQPAISRPMMAPRDDGDIAVEQQNPRRIGTAAYVRYDKYKAARTREELEQMGASRRDVTSGCRLGYIKTKPADIAAVRETLRKKPNNTKRAVKKDTELFTAVMSMVMKIDILNEKFDRIVSMCAVP